MTANAVALVAVALVSLAGVIYTAHATRAAADRATRVAERSVDADAYERARSIDRATIDVLRADLDRCTRTGETLHADLTAARRETGQLREHVDRLESAVGRLRGLLGATSLLDERDRHPDPPRET